MHVNPFKARIFDSKRHESKRMRDLQKKSEQQMAAVQQVVDRAIERWYTISPRRHSPNTSKTHLVPNINATIGLFNELPSNTSRLKQNSKSTPQESLSSTQNQS